MTIIVALFNAASKWNKVELNRVCHFHNLFAPSFILHTIPNMKNMNAI